MSGQRWAVVDIGHGQWVALEAAFVDSGMDEGAAGRVADTVAEWLLGARLVDRDGWDGATAILAEWVALMPAIAPPPLADALAYLRMLGLPEVQAATAATYKKLGSSTRMGAPLGDEALLRYWHGACTMRLQRGRSA